eukprot:6083798-Amphidinium_carterae.2
MQKIHDSAIITCGKNKTKIDKALELNILGFESTCLAVLRGSIQQRRLRTQFTFVWRAFGCVSCACLISLWHHLQDHLKTEIGVFIEQIFLRILESGNSTFQHKVEHQLVLARALLCPHVQHHTLCLVSCGAFCRWVEEELRYVQLSCGLAKQLASSIVDDSLSLHCACKRKGSWTRVDNNSLIRQEHDSSVGWLAALLMLRVLQVFYKLCTDASTALELFINFDCDVDEKCAA